MLFSYILPAFRFSDLSKGEWDCEKHLSIRKGTYM